MRRSVGPGVFVCSVLLLVCAVPSLLCQAQQPAAAPAPAAAPVSYKPLTVDRIYRQPGLSGRLTRGIAWTPDSKQLSFFESKGAGKEAKTELWVMDVANGQRRLLLSADKLESVLPAGAERTTQATGLGRHAPAEYQWAPNGSALLFQGPTSLAWFDLKTQAVRTLVSGKETIADPKISPDGQYVSFVRNHNLWLAVVADGKERAFTQGGTEEVRKGELDWVYPEELEITTAYWWAPDSSAIAYLQMDESKVAQYPLVDFASPAGEAEEERYPPAGGGNPIVRVFVAPVGGGEAHAMDTGENPDIYIARVNWLTDARHLAIQRLNRRQTVLDLLIADATSGQTHAALNETDQYWINVSNDLRFLKDGKRFLWSSERSGYRHLYLYDLEGKELAQLTRGEWEVSAVDAVDEAKGLVYFTGTAKSPLERHLYRVALDGTAFTRLTKDAGTHAAVFAPNDAAFYDTYSNAAAPPRQDLYRADGSRIATINENKIAELADYHLSPMEFFTVKSRDDIQLNASIIKPPDFNPQKKYPVLIYTYGGPRAQVVRNAWGGADFLWHELMAQKGYIIFSVDNRGSA